MGFIIIILFQHRGYGKEIPRIVRSTGAVAAEFLELFFGYMNSEQKKNNKNMMQDDAR